MSRTAKRPRGGYSENASTHMGLLGTSLNGSFSRLYELWVLFSSLTCTSVNLLFDFGKLAGNVSGVTIRDRRVSVGPC